MMSGILRRKLGFKKRKKTRSLKPPTRIEALDYNDNPKIEKLIFICGLHRSGTTLLERKIVSQYDVSHLRASVPESEGQHLQQVFPSARKFGGAGRFAFSTEMVAALDDLPPPEECRERILKDWSRFVVGDGSTLLEKSPPNLTKIDWLRKVFPGSRFVIMMRDPRAVSAATLKWSKTSLPELMMHWNVAHTSAMQSFREDDCTVIRYEDLCADPDAELKRVADFLGLVPRADTQQVEERHGELRNSNGKYIDMHGDIRYGVGLWERFGYEA